MSKDPFESTYQLLINGREKVRIKKLKKRQNQLLKNDDVYENLGDHNSTKKNKALTVFDGLIPDI